MLRYIIGQVFLILFVYLFGLFFSPTREFFYGEKLQILTYAWHSWPLTSEGFFLRATPTVTRGIR